MSTVSSYGADLEKAAILVSALDTKAADALLDSLPAELAQDIRNAVLQLPAAAKERQESVLREFYQLLAQSQPSDDVILELSSASAGEPIQGSHIEATKKHFRRLVQIDCQQLAELLAVERPQTIALVLAHLPPQQAGKVLAGLPADLQVDVIRRLIDLEETDPEILREIENALEHRLSAIMQRPRRRIAGLGAVSTILQATDRRSVAAILQNLGSRDRLLAQQLGLPSVRFPDLFRLDDASLALLLRRAGLTLVKLALMDAPDEYIERACQLLSDQAEALRNAINNPGPVRLREIDHAKKELCKLAEQLLSSGQISFPIGYASR